MIFHTKEKGHSISYDSVTGLYTVRNADDEVLKESKSQEAIEKFLITGEKKKIKAAFDRIPAYFFTHWTGYVECEITSLAEKDNYNSRQYVWISYFDEHKNPHRSKESVLSVYARSEKNAQLIEKIKATEAEREKLSEEVTKLTQGLERVSVPQKEKEE